MRALECRETPIMTTLKRAAPWLLAVYIAFVFVQSLFFKFQGAPESIYIFQTIEDWSGLSFFEPFMRNFIGASELLVSFLLFVPVTQVLGAAGALLIISGAIFFHLVSPLGVVVAHPPTVESDGGLLFAMACGVWVSAALILYLRRDRIRHLPRDLGFTA